jgi:oligopeptide/dipeptide ABC transporter ATP-binding protein
MHDIRGNRIAMVFQEPTTSLNPVLNVGAQIAEAIEIHQGLGKEQAKRQSIELLELVRIPDAQKRITDFPHQFSGGMQQRLMIAMALSCNPDILIADEPTTSVDVTVQAQLLELISDLQSTYETSVILITHNLGLVARYVDRVYVMYAGRIVETGTTDQIFTEPTHPYTRGLLASVPRLDLPRTTGLQQISGLPPNLACLPGGCAFHPRCEYATDKCRKTKPKLELLVDDHFVACHRRGSFV